MSEQNKDKYHHKYLKYKKKYDSLRKQSDNDYNSIRVGCALLHEIDNSDYVLMVQDNENHWKLPSDFIFTNDNNKNYNDIASNTFKKVTNIETPIVSDQKLFQNGGNRILVGNVDHIDTDKFKSSDYAQNIGFISVDMLKEHNFYPKKSIHIDPYTSDILQMMEDQNII